MIELGNMKKRLLVLNSSLGSMGKIGVEFFGEEIITIDLEPEEKIKKCLGKKSEELELVKEEEIEKDLLVKKTKEQFEKYFRGELKEFDLPLKIEGTDFQKKVWAELRRIPYGQTRSYGEIARGVDCPKGPRAVGMANNRNKLPIIIPCHRVIGGSGKLVGYATGLEKKVTLLELEKKYS